MAQIIRLPIELVQGFVPSAAATGPNSAKGAVVNGRNFLWLGRGLMKSAKGLGAGPAGTGGTRLFVTNNAIATVNGTGSIIAYKQGLFYFLSVESTAGLFSIPGLVSAAGTGGRLKYTRTGVIYNAGLAAPTSAPVLTASMTAGINNSGATAVKVTKVRTAMILGESNMGVFEESNPSPASNVIAISNKKVKISNFPSAPAAGDPDFYDAYGIYATPSNAGSLKGNPFQFLRVIPISAVVGGIYETEWNDNELLPQTPPDDFFPPPTDGMFVLGLGNVVFIVGCEGGTRFAPSKPGQLGAFPPLSRGLMSPAEQPIGTAARATDGELLVWTMNSLQSFLLSGDPLAPIYNRAIWASTGIPSPMGGCFADKEFYCFIAKSGPAKLGENGAVETGFALPIRDYLFSLNWDATKVSVGYDPVNDGVVFAYRDDALVYMRSLGVWCVPITLNANLGSDVQLITFQGQLIVGKGGGLFTWEGGLVDQSWFIVTAKQDAPDPMDIKNLTGYRIHCNMDGLVAKLFTDDTDSESGAAKHTLTDMGSGEHYTSWSKALLNLACKNFQLRLAGTKKNQQINNIEFEMIYTQGLRDLR